MVNFAPFFFREKKATKKRIKLATIVANFDYKKKRKKKIKASNKITLF